MAFEIQQLDGLVHVKLTGHITGDDLIAMAKVFSEIEPRYDVSPHRISDCSEVEDVVLNFAEMEAFAAKRRVARLKNKVKSAIVATKPIQFGFARMFQTLNNNPNIEIVIFSDAENARNWINEA